MRIQGVDPTILNRIQEKVNKQAVHDTRQAEISKEKRQRENKGKRERPDRDALIAAVKKLNGTAESLGLRLFFMLSDGDEPAIFLVNKDTQQIIREIPPESVLTMLTEMKSFVGMLVDHHL
jgi:flagellar protein FlaG